MLGCINLMPLNKYFLTHLVTQAWQKKGLLAILLLPLSYVFALIGFIRRQKKTDAKLSPCPILVVGNLSVGGTGKTPLTIALIDFCHQQGIQVGVISRGYQGKAPYPYIVDQSSQPEQCGDEPFLIYQKTQCPIVVHPDRFQAAQTLSQNFAVDLIISDDGLQHYRLPRQFELVVVDAKRQFGNGWLLPAGPLREPISRLRQVNGIVVNGKTPLVNPPKPMFHMQLKPQSFVTLGQTQGLPEQKRVHAIAGIGHPERFFNTLKQMGFEVIEHPFPDHYQFKQSDITFADGVDVVMTEKDAVKCQSMTALNQHWYLTVAAELPSAFWQFFSQQISNTLLIRSR